MNPHLVPMAHAGTATPLGDLDTSPSYELETVQPLGNYAVQLTWKDQFNQVATFELLASLPRVKTSSVSPV